MRYFLVPLWLLACRPVTDEPELSTQVDPTLTDTTDTVPVDTNPPEDTDFPVSGACEGPLDEWSGCADGCPTKADLVARGGYEETECGEGFSSLRSDFGRLVTNYRAVFDGDGTLVAVYEFTDYTPYCDSRSFDITYGPMPSDCP